jgi:peptide/nickel transport system substrate-binding protein
MKRKTLWAAVCGLMLLTLLIAACGQPTSSTTKTTQTSQTQTTQTSQTATTTKTSSTSPAATTTTASNEKPKYGGTMVLSLIADVTTFAGIENCCGNSATNLVVEDLWHGDWTKGPAGGYGQNLTDWGGWYDVWEHKAGVLAESTTWTSDFTNNTGTIVYKIRQGVHFGLDTTSPASKQVNGREMTADDVVTYLKRSITEQTAYLFKTNLDLRKAVITKSGPWEVTVVVPLDTLVTAIFRFSDVSFISPAELSAAVWTQRTNCVGTGPYMLTDYVPASQMTLTRNPNYWQKNPIGPGKGDQLPYIDTIQLLIVPDLSTRQAALRTARLDQLGSFELADANAMKKQVPAMKTALSGEAMKPLNSPESIDMPVNTAPFNDVKVRQAMMLATDFESINKSLYGGIGQIVSWPWGKTPGYEKIHVGLEDADCPKEMKDLYTYNPAKAKQLLTEAGFPNGFKTTAVMLQQYVDFYSIIKDEWLKAGIDLSFNVMESPARTSYLNKGDWGSNIVDGGVASVSAWHTSPTLTGMPSANANTSRIFDPKIDQGLIDVRNTIVKSGMSAGMDQMRELLKYIMVQAYAIPVPYVPVTTFWWPWLKNYTGELSVGYYDAPNWATYTWIDQDLKKSMGK